MDLAGRVVVVTGAGRGIGRALAQGLAAAGGLVVVSDIDRAELERTRGLIATPGHPVHPIHADVSDAASVQDLIDGAVSAFGRVDVLVNNAGRAGMVSFLDMEEAEWDRVMATNLRGVFLCCRAAARQMVRQGGGGTIINITSALGIKGARSSAHYAASKGGVNALTRSLAAELAVHGIEVVAAGPGQTDTPMWRSMYPEAEQAARRAAGQMQDLAEFVNLVVFLASPMGRGLSGQVIARGVYVPT